MGSGQFDVDKSHCAVPLCEGHSVVREGTGRST